MLFNEYNYSKLLVPACTYILHAIETTRILINFYSSQQHYVSVDNLTTRVWEHNCFLTMLHAKQIPTGHSSQQHSVSVDNLTTRVWEHNCVLTMLHGKHIPTDHYRQLLVFIGTYRIKEVASYQNNTTRKLIKFKEKQNLPVKHVIIYIS